MANDTPVPASLPPPYTATGKQASSIRADPTTFTTTTTLLLGPDPTPTRYLLHTSLLTSQSPYFRACLLGPFLESTTQTIALRDITDTATFELLVTWLYTGAITPTPFKDGKPAYYTLLNLYALADRLAFEGLRNMVVDMIADLADKTNSVLTPSDTRLLYDVIPPSAPLRNLVLDLFAFKKTDKLLAEHEDPWHAAFLRDLVVLLKRPCEQALQRHRLALWYPGSWAATQACEGCRGVVPPRYGAVRCEECFVVWCSRCVGEGVGMAGWEGGSGGSGGRYVRVSGTGLGSGSSASSVSSGVSSPTGSRSNPGSVPHTPSTLGFPASFRDGMGSSPARNGAGNASSLRDSGIGWEGDGHANGAHHWETGGYEVLPSGKKVRIRKWQSCKPWRGSRCALYHEHQETERCGEVFMGR